MEKGIPGTAMKPNESLNDFQAATIVAYLRSIAANPSLTSALAGDPAQGKELFENKGGCLSCHRVKSRGSRLGPNLSEIGANRRTVEIEHAIVDPSPDALRRIASSAWLPRMETASPGGCSISTRSRSSCWIRMRLSARSQDRICANPLFCRSRTCPPTKTSFRRRRSPMW